MFQFLEPSAHLSSAKLKNNAGEFLLRRHLLTPHQYPQDIQQMLSINIEFHLSPFWGSTTIQPLVIYDGFWVMNWLADLVLIFNVTKK
jgi:hypothetical protein